jgi:hypothetical protein
MKTKIACKIIYIFYDDLLDIGTIIGRINELASYLYRSHRPE